MGIKLFNKFKKGELSLIEDTFLYKVKLSKKSGLPDLDLPSLNENLTLMELNHVNFSISIEDQHIYITPNKKFNHNFDALSIKNAFKQNSKDGNELKENFIQVEKKKYCCAYYICNIFK